MVYIKRVELSHFKSFGGTAAVPLLPGFTVVTGPNGSGKSNILDGLLFALGLSSSKGMRADKLPDLVNQTYASRSRSTVEASVTVTFSLLDWRSEEDEDEETEASSIAVKSGLAEWNVTRKLRVTPQGTYTSTYYINGESCTLTQLHEQLSRLRIYPEGYNVVLQGDVTGIISMHPKERREIIDEMAGVAQFDRKIGQAKEKLDAVKEREDRCHIVERELQEQLERLAKDRVKAERYKQLRQELEEKERWEIVLVWREGMKQAEGLRLELEKGDRTRETLNTQIAAAGQQVQETAQQLDALNQRVKALGEAELIQCQSNLATRQAEQRQIQRQQQELSAAAQTTEAELAREQQSLQQSQDELNCLQQTQIPQQQGLLARLTLERDEARRALEESRSAANAIASESQAWVQQQQGLRQQVDALVSTLEPQRIEQSQLQERSQQLAKQIQDQEIALEQVEAELTSQTYQLDQTQRERDTLAPLVQEAVAAVAGSDQELQLQTETRDRLLREQRDKQRQLDRAEAQTQALQDSQGTTASRVIIQAGLSGVHGIVAQLGQVEKRYQLALETAAGARLGYIVVEDDSVAAAGINLLKQQRAGRATFLPLNKIRPSSLADLAKWNQPQGLIDHAVNLVDCDRRYETIFSYVFGGTVVFDEIGNARRHLGQFRIVTLEGDLLESSGAMTGGSINRQRGGLGFGQAEAGESREIQELRDRLGEIEVILERCERAIHQLGGGQRERIERLNELRNRHREFERLADQLQTSVRKLTQQQEQLKSGIIQNRDAWLKAQTRLDELALGIPERDRQLTDLRHQLAQVEQSPLHSEWQQRQALVQSRETHLQERELALRATEQTLRDLDIQQQRLGDRAQQTQQRLHALREQQTQQINQQSTLQTQAETLQQQITQLQTELASLDQRLGSEKQDRDRTERLLREHQGQQQQLTWQLEKLDETQTQQRDQLTQLSQNLDAKQTELPDPLPEIPEETQQQGVVALQVELRSLAKRIQAMEPVNMLALEEYDRTQTRLTELTEKLQTLESERTELLVRIENFTTLRQRAFMEAYDAVNTNFQAIFALLSDGDGSLQLDDAEDPLNSGLNLIAHPKGKPVRRLASMSGGEKSLTALSFIFALQRYRPSPFYSFDEVDSFLDGANVERLAKVIRQQCDQAQFIVVSHRRPMIETAQRTIGVTQARGAHTQVLGISHADDPHAASTAPAPDPAPEPATAP